MRRALSTHGQARLSGVEALAEAQLGLLTRAQCLGLGMTASALKWMVHAGRWQMVHPGVYATHVGPLDWRARVSAAVLYCGDGAVASHSTAARLHGLVEQDPDGIEVLIPSSRRVTRPSQVRLATCADISRRTAPSGWPTRTTVEDTVLDMAEHGDADNAIAWVSKACQRRRTTPARLADALDKRARHRWRELLVDALSDVAAGVESVLEYRYVRSVERPHGLPEARRQQVAILGGRRRRTDNESSRSESSSSWTVDWGTRAKESFVTAPATTVRRSAARPHSGSAGPTSTSSHAKWPRTWLCCCGPAVGAVSSGAVGLIVGCRRGQPEGSWLP